MGEYIHKMEIPVSVLYSKRDDGTLSIDSVDVPTEEKIYGIVAENASKIIAGAEQADVRESCLTIIQCDKRYEGCFDSCQLWQPPAA